jgi:hypothetical protein
MKAIRWGDNDKYVGPFTFSRDGRYKSKAILLGSGDGDEYAGCRLRISGFGGTLIVALPQIIKPWREWVDTSKYSWSDNPNGGYWDLHKREYGFSLHEGFLNLSLGRVTNDSSTEQRKGYFLPWTQWRCVAHRFYDDKGELALTDSSSGPQSIEASRDRWAAQDAVPTVSFNFKDFDGEAITASTRIEEYEHRLGEGWFKWLSLIRKARVRRSLGIKFSGETGKRKGSWKGGTLGHGISMEPGEMHEAAFQRYCKENSMTYEGIIQ